MDEIVILVLEDVFDVSIKNKKVVLVVIAGVGLVEFVPIIGIVVVSKVDVIFFDDETPEVISGIFTLIFMVKLHIYLLLNFLTDTTVLYFFLDAFEVIFFFKSNLNQT